MVILGNDSITRSITSLYLGRRAINSKWVECFTEGSPITLGEVKLTVRDKINKIYQTPYGSVSIQRYDYQSSKGGKIYCPLENNAQIIRGATSKFAQQISHKYVNKNAPAVCQDLNDNHYRKIAHSYLQDVSDWVGSIAQAKEEIWEYATPRLNEAISTVVILRWCLHRRCEKMDTEETMVCIFHCMMSPENGNTPSTLEKPLNMVKGFFYSA